MIKRKNSSGTYDLLSGSDVPVDNLTSTSTTQPLSANQGKVLNDTKLSLTGGTMTGAIGFAGTSNTLDNNGDELTFGGKKVLTDAVESGSISFNSGCSMNYTLRKQGTIVVLNFRDLTATGSEIGYLPEGFRPPFVCYGFYSGTGNDTGMIEANPNGKIQIYNPGYDRRWGFIVFTTA